MNKRLILATLLVLFSTFIVTTHSLRHHLKIKNDRRISFNIEGFGFNKGGVMSLNVTNWMVNGKLLDKADTSNGFVIKITGTDGSSYIEEMNYEDCSIDSTKSDVSFNYNGNPSTYKINVNSDSYPEGFYNLYFVNCNSSAISFDLDLVEYNIDPNGDINYLSIGNSPLPSVYGAFSAVFFALLVFWFLVFLKGEGKRVNKIHHLCTLYLLIQSIELLFEAIEMHYIKTTGGANGWDIAYYVFACIQGSFFIVLIALIGTGWTFIKPFLSDKDKTIFMIVIPLQILANIALVMVDEEAPGSVGWASWKQIFTIVDIVCCGAILIPIVWSISHLKDASQVDDKAAQNLQKLKLFRQFYLFVMSYLYFTRVIIFLVKATLPFHYIWLGDFFALFASLVFYSATGYQFRPSLDNPYFQVPSQSQVELEDL